MAFPNSTYTDIVTTTLENRSKKTADNVTKNNAVLRRLEKKGKIRPVDGGREIVEELLFAENGNGGWYSGYDTLPTAPQDVISAANFSWKQYAVPVIWSGLEEMQNSGEEAVLDLIAERIKAAEATMANDIADGLHSDGTGTGGKEITGLEAAVPQDPTTGTYGGINRATASNTFWRSQLHDPASTPTTSTILTAMNTLWVSCVRGNDRPDLILSGGTIFQTFLGALQPNQRFMDPELAEAGFTTVKYMTADVVLDGGIGGFLIATDMVFLNTNYIHYRPHKRRNMVPIGKRRTSFNQDATAEVLGWMGNLTSSGPQFCGRLKGD